MGNAAELCCWMHSRLHNRLEYALQGTQHGACCLLSCQPGFVLLPRHTCCHACVAFQMWFTTIACKCPSKLQHSGPLTNPT